MPNKHVLIRSEAREKFLHGATTLADAVRVTTESSERAARNAPKWVRRDRLVA